MNTVKDNNFKFIHIFILFCLALPFIYAMGFTFPGGDDFARAIKARHFLDIIGGFEELGRAWWKWSGRYTHHFLVVFFGDAATSRVLYTFVCLLNVALFLFSIWGISKSIAPSISKKTTFTYALFLLIAVLSSNASLDSIWYLITDILSLGVAFNFTLLYIYSLTLIWDDDEPSSNKRWFCILSGIIAAGCYEYSTIMVVAISFTVYLLALNISHPQTKFFLKLFTISLVCFFISFLAHGNFHRMNRREVTESKILNQFLTAWHGWSNYIIKLFPVILYPCVAIWSIWISPYIKIKKVSKFPFLIGTLYAFAVAIGFSLAVTIVHSLSDIPVDAAPKTGANIFLFLSLVFAFYILYYKEEFKLLILNKIPKNLLFIIGILLICSTFNWQQTLYQSLNGSFNIYANIKEERLKLYENNQGKDIEVAPILFKPFPVYYQDPVTINPKAWPTKYVSKLYGLNSVTIKATQPSQILENLKTEGLNFKQVNNIPQVQELAFAKQVEVEGNATYTNDWIILKTAKTNDLKNIYISTITSPILPSILTLPNKVTLESYIKISAEQIVELKEYLCHTSPEDDYNIFAIPLHLGKSFKLYGLYISFDNKDFYNITYITEAQ